jgi:uncharacterized membrane protein YqhA
LIFPDAIPQQICGSKPILWVLNNAGHSLRQLMMMMIKFLTYGCFISLLDTEGDKKVNVARIILERLQQLTGRDSTQRHGH